MNKESPACIVETTLLLISSKWKFLILQDMNDTMRYSELNPFAQFHNDHDKVQDICSYKRKDGFMKRRMKLPFMLGLLYIILFAACLLFMCFINIKV